MKNKLILLSWLFLFPLYAANVTWESPVTPLSVKLMWDASPTTSVNKYTVYESRGAATSFIQLGDTISLFYNLSVNYGEYKWRVTASNKFGESEPVELGFYLVMPPLAPTNEAPISPINLILADQNNLVLNGGFEKGVESWFTNGNLIVSTRSNELTNCISFNSGQSIPNGTIWQSLTTIPNSKYLLFFDVGLFSWVKNGQQKLELQIGNTNTSQIIVVETPMTLGLNTWTNKTFHFVADSTNTVLQFSDVSLITTNIDLLLDNVRVYRQLVP